MYFTAPCSVCSLSQCVNRGVVKSHPACHSESDSPESLLPPPPYFSRAAKWHGQAPSICDKIKCYFVWFLHTVPSTCISCEESKRQFQGVTLSRQYLSRHTKKTIPSKPDNVNKSMRNRPLQCYMMVHYFSAGVIKLQAAL